MGVLSRSIFLSMLGISASFAGLSPWNAPPIYNPLGIAPIYYPPVPPPLYNPGPGNLAPSYSYTQPSAQSSDTSQQPSISNLLDQNAKNVIAKWRQLVVSSRGNPDNIKDTDKNIAADQSALDIAASTPGLTSDQLNNIGQIKILLDLALVRWLNDQVSKAKASFPDARSAALKGTTSKIDSAWYVARRNQLGALLEKFQQFLNKNPQYSQNPPSLLVGLLETLIKGQKSFAQYQQFCNCFDNPELQYCAELGAASKGQSQSRNNDQEDNSDQQGQWVQDEDGQWVQA